MKIRLKKYILLLCVVLSSVISSPFILAQEDVNVLLPVSTWEEDVNIDYPQVESNELTIFGYIQRINKYLWLFIACVAMAVLVYAWILLITAWGDKSKVSKWWKLALSCIIAILVAMFSVALVNLIINLF